MTELMNTLRGIEKEYGVLAEVEAKTTIARVTEAFDSEEVLGAIKYTSAEDINKREFFVINNRMFMAKGKSKIVETAVDQYVGDEVAMCNLSKIQHSLKRLLLKDLQRSSVYNKKQNTLRVGVSHMPLYLGEEVQGKKYSIGNSTISEYAGQPTYLVVNVEATHCEVYLHHNELMYTLFNLYEVSSLSTFALRVIQQLMLVGHDILKLDIDDKPQLRKVMVNKILKSISKYKDSTNSDVQYYYNKVRAHVITKAETDEIDYSIELDTLSEILMVKEEESIGNLSDAVKQLKHDLNSEAKQDNSMSSFSNM